MKKCIILITALVLFYKTGNCQAPAGQIKELKIGDTIPPIILKGFLNNPSDQLAVDKLYTKGLLIVDFWATWCVPCIGELKEMGSLTKKFPNKLSVLSVAYENLKTIQDFFKRHPEIDTSSVQILTNDKILSKYFPHTGLPHNVWIDSKGVVRAITFPDEITEVNINKLLNGEHTNLLIKKDNLTFDYEKPFHVEDTLLQYRSVFSNYDPGISSGTLVDRGVYADKSLVRRVFAWNNSITQLLWLGAFAKLPFQAPDENYKMIEIHTADSSKFLQSTFVHSKATKATYGSILNWTMKNTYCYELILPKPVPDTLASTYVMTDLLRNLHVETKIEKRERSCQIIKLDKGSLLEKAEGGLSEFKLTAHEVIIRNMTLKEILQQLNHYFPNLDPFIDETGINYPINITLHNDATGLSFVTFRSLLEKHGFLFSTKNRKVDVLVIKDAAIL